MVTGMIDAVADAGADNTGATDTTLALSDAVAMCFGFNTMAQLDAALPPLTKVRPPEKWLYIPPGTYRMQGPLVLESMQGLDIRGGGFMITLLVAEGGSAANPLTAVLDLNGIAYSTFRDFGVGVAGSGDVRALIYLHWDPNRAGRSTTRNAFTNVAAGPADGTGVFREAAWQLGALAGDGPPGYQCDQTELFNVGAGGDYDRMRGDRDLVGGVMKKDLYFQRGFRFGDGEYGNNGWHHAHGLYSNYCRFGVDWWAAECPIFGGLIQSNDIDLYASEPPGVLIGIFAVRLGPQLPVSGDLIRPGPGLSRPYHHHASRRYAHATIRAKSTGHRERHVE